MKETIISLDRQSDGTYGDPSRTRKRDEAAKQRATTELVKRSDLLKQAEEQFRTGRSETKRPSTGADDDQLPEFPESAWRGIFADYREAMAGTTEASPVAHFATLWAGAAAALGRNVHMYSGDYIYANAYVCFYGPTGDKKTTAQRRLIAHSLLPPSVLVVNNVGSTEGLAGYLEEQDRDPTTGLFFWEEFSSLLSRGRWTNSTILEFITETFDCPPEWGLQYRKKNKISIPRPTPTILTGTTADWFWRNARPADFYGGFGNRFVFLTGRRKPPLPEPRQPNPVFIQAVRGHIERLSCLRPTTAKWTNEASRLWAAFYRDWEGQERDGLLGAALKRIHVYVRKLALVYSACESALPEVTLDQLQAAIAVGQYAATCAELLIDERGRATTSEGDLERRFLTWVDRNPGARVRMMQQTMSKYCTAEQFNRVLKSLAQADRIEIRGGKHRQLYPTPQ